MWTVQLENQTVAIRLMVGAILYLDAKSNMQETTAANAILSFFIMEISHFVKVCKSSFFQKMILLLTVLTAT